MTPEQARARFPSEPEALDALRLALRDVPILDAVPVLMPGYERPTWLAPLADCYERAFLAAQGVGKPVLALVSAPAQVGKTTLGQVAAVWWLAQRPQDWLSLLMYGQKIADAKSKDVRRLALELGLSISEDSRAADRWATPEGGGFLARGLAAGIVGQPGLVLLDVDDPYMRRAQAESATERETIHGEVRASVFTRRHPRTSVIIKHTRYTPGDLIGEMQREHGDMWEVHAVPAVADDGTPIVTLGGRTGEWWAEQRTLMGEYDWWSLMMARPRPRGGALFQGVTLYEGQPSGLRTCIGVDLAYSSKTKADYSVAVVVGYGDGRAYVLDMVRAQCSAPEFAAHLKRLRSRWPCPMRAYLGGTEKGIADFLAKDGLPLDVVPATEDKHTRAQPTVAAWNRQQLMVPRDAPWVDALTSEVLDFTGVKDRHDDIVDALVAAYDGAARASTIRVEPPTKQAPNLGGPRGLDRRRLGGL